MNRLLRDSMRDGNVRYLLVQTAVGDYRQGVIDKVICNFGQDFQILCGDCYFDESTKTRISAPKNLRLTKNIFFFGRKLLIQPGAILPALNAESLILEMNPRILSVWIIIILRRFLGRKTVLWGHAWPRSGKSSRSDVLRNMLRVLGNHILVYTDTQKIELQNRMPAKGISSAPNSLYSAEEMWVPKSERRNFLYVGRLVSNKKPDLMIRAFSKALAERNIGDLVIVGDGPASPECRSLVNELKISDRVHFKGHINDLDTLRELYSRAVASISPGYVGLSITQSFSFGTPMIVADREPHAPEIEAAVEGENCYFFRANDVQDLKDKILMSWSDRNSWEARTEEIIEGCKTRYSTDLMAARLEEAFRLCQT